MSRFVRKGVGGVAVVLEVGGPAQRQVGADSRVFLKTPSSEGIIDIGRVIGYHDEEIPVAPGMCDAAGATAKEPNPPRVPGPHDAIEQASNGAQIDLPTKRILRTLEARNHAFIVAYRSMDA